MTNAAIATSPVLLSNIERDALMRLFDRARGDTGHSRKAADLFLPGEQCHLRQLDLATQFRVDEQITADMVTVFACCAGRSFFRTL